MTKIFLLFVVNLANNSPLLAVIHASIRNILSYFFVTELC